MNVHIDISEADAEESPAVIATDVAGDAYQVSLGDLILTINYEQMQRLYLQLRPWFEDDKS